MSVLRVYLDTSVIGGCCDAEFARWSLALVRDIRLGLIVPVISDITESELAAAPPEVQAVYDELEDGVHERVEETPESIELAEKYLAEGILSAKFRDDARHIAVATVHDVDVLVSWNFKHVVHHDKIRRFNAVNVLLGYGPLQVFTPLEVTSA